MPEDFAKWARSARRGEPESVVKNMLANVVMPPASFDSSISIQSAVCLKAELRPVSEEADTAGRAAIRRPRCGTMLAVSDQGRVDLQTATVQCRFRDRITRKPFTVDLVSVVHVGEPGYYELLQEQCDGYDPAPGPPVLIGHSFGGMYVSVARTGGPCGKRAGLAALPVSGKLQ